jgi:hypothetical protein
MIIARGRGSLTMLPFSGGNVNNPSVNYLISFIYSLSYVLASAVGQHVWLVIMGWSCQTQKTLYPSVCGG